MNSFSHLAATILKVYDKNLTSNERTKLLNGILVYRNDKNLIFEGKMYRNDQVIFIYLTFESLTKTKEGGLSALS